MCDRISWRRAAQQRLSRKASRSKVPINCFFFSLGEMPPGTHTLHPFPTLCNHPAGGGHPPLPVTRHLIGGLGHPQPASVTLLKPLDLIVQRLMPEVGLVQF